MVDEVYSRGYTTTTTRYTILRYSIFKKETADYSAITTWGIFYPDEDSPANLILLDAIKGRYEFPELRRLALEQYDYWKPETVIVEAKASGLPLTYELSRWIYQLSTLVRQKETTSTLV